MVLWEKVFCVYLIFYFMLNMYKTIDKAKPANCLSLSDVYRYQCLALQ